LAGAGNACSSSLFEKIFYMSVISQQSEKRKPALFYPIVLAAIVAAGLFLRCLNIQQGLWWDEIWSTLEYATSSSWWYTISRLGYYFNNHPLYSILCRLSIQVLGLTELSVRLPSLVLGVATLPVLYCLARPLAGAVPALLATFLLAISAFHIDHSTEARGYAAMVFCGLLTTHFFFNALRTGIRRYWVLYVVCTFLGFCFHVYMAQFSLVQLVCCLLLLADQRLRKPQSPQLYEGALKQLIIALGVGAALTLAAYAPMLRFFIANAGKVKFYSVDRLPFVVDMYQTVLPGVTTLPGMLVYSILTLCGLLYLRTRSAILCLYVIFMCNLPVLLYLQLNPMFVSTRYFLPIVPFSLLVLACGIEWLSKALRLSGVKKFLFLTALLCVIAALQLPSIGKVILENRQHYREAIDFVEKHAVERDPVVFAIGYAGSHFRHYAKVPVIVPETFAEFKARVDEGREVWCLISAWLPELRPAHESVELYAEDPQHVLIYDYVTSNFQPAAQYPARYPTYVYRSPAMPRPGT
jgi:4-amino-4-deoxy-L-arabinose transferase-like glycosyltransferase